MANLKETLDRYAEIRKSDELKEQLYQYLTEGWYLFPVCWFDESGQCACGYRDKEGKPHTENQIGKAPITLHGMKDATTLKIGVDEYLKKYPLAGWAGYFPHQLILDVDTRHNGYAGLAKLEADIGKLPPTRTHVTGSGGLHIIYRLPEGVTLRASKLNGYEGIDVKINGYIVLPPSPHVSGGAYHVK